MNAMILRRGAMLAAGFALGLAVAWLAFGRDDGTTATPAARATDGTTDPTLPAAPDTPVPPGGAPAADPVAAVTAFLHAEASNDFRASWGLLAAEDRAAYRSVDRWVAAHESIAPVTGFDLVDTAAADGAVPVRLHLRAGLDGVLGLVPAEADATLVAVEEDGGWRVAFGRSTSTPLLLDDAGAPAGTAEWIAGRQICDDPRNEHRTLVGVTGLADGLCGTDDASAAPVAGLLPAADAPRFVSAYGPDVTTWARVVDIDGSVPQRAVLAPVGDRWLVVGVLPPAL